MKNDKSSLVSNTNIFFENDSYRLDMNGKMLINELINDPSISIIGVELKGYADVSGGSGYNFKLSERRIASVGKIFEANGIPFVPKPYGLDRSTYDQFSLTHGNPF